MSDPTKYLPGRCETLERISGLTVTVRQVEKGKGEYIFTFHKSKFALKEIFTYRKARTFAEGIELGRRLALETVPG